MEDHYTGFSAIGNQLYKPALPVITHDSHFALIRGTPMLSSHKVLPCVLNVFGAQAMLEGMPVYNYLFHLGLLSYNGIIVHS